MGWTPREVDACSLWQFAAAVDGWNTANGGEEAMPAPPSPREFQQMLDRAGW
ncbi:hypothetical protein [Azorhizobium sp. AG788]|uniref:hypothetical protein n=1 Tax=Azorhizobium sp. AG788 TaxID=2183897 RepID=UPI001414DCF6|nr:hypothetical protein [Azorhizobium sp. AG788]